MRRIIFLVQKCMEARYSKNFKPTEFHIPAVNIMMEVWYTLFVESTPGSVKFSSNLN